MERLDVSYERACMATAREEYYKKMLDSLLDDNDRHGTPSSSKKLQEVVIRVMAETEEEKKDAERNVNNVTMDTLFQSPVTINTQRKDANLTNEIKIASGIHAETIKEFKGFTIQSTISDSAHSNSEELVYAVRNSEELVDAVSNSEELVDAVRNSEELVDAISDPKSDPSIYPKVSTYTTNGISPKKLLANR